MLMAPMIDKIFILTDEKYEPHKCKKWKHWMLHNANTQFFCGTWINELTDDDVARYYVRCPIIEAREIEYNPKSEYPILRAYIAATISWMKLFEYIHAMNYNRVIIFESDVYFDSSFDGKLRDAMNLIQCINNEEWDILSISDGGINSHFRLNDQYVMPGIFKMSGTRNIDAAVYNYSAIDKILKYGPTFTLPIDLHIRELIWKGHINMWWLEPTICTQMSQKGLCDSSISLSPFSELNYPDIGEDEKTF